MLRVLSRRVGPGGRIHLADFAPSEGGKRARWVTGVYYGAIAIAGWALRLCALHGIPDLAGVVVDLAGVDGWVDGVMSLQGATDALDGEIRLGIRDVDLYGALDAADVADVAGPQGDVADIGGPDRDVLPVDPVEGALVLYNVDNAPGTVSVSAVGRSGPVPSTGQADYDGRLGN